MHLPRFFSYMFVAIFIVVFTSCSRNTNDFVVSNKSMKTAEQYKIDHALVISPSGKITLKCALRNTMLAKLANAKDIFAIAYCYALQEVRNNPDFEEIFLGLDYIGGIRERGFNDIEFRMDFWDEERQDRCLSPFLAQILCKEGTVYYYEADPNNPALRLVCKESGVELIKRMAALVQSQQQRGIWGEPPKKKVAT